MVPNEILQAVYQISSNNGKTFGSCIAVSVDNWDYLITAKHLFDKIPNNTEIPIWLFRNEKWEGNKGKLLLHTNPDIDIAVIRAGTQHIKPRFDIGGHYFVSQDVFFVGFPFGLKMEDLDSSFNNGFPAPFIKKGIISGFTWENRKTQFGQIFIDATNNKGFSGGPVVVVNQQGTDNKHNMRLIGIVSGFLNEPKTISLPNGVNVSTTENTGIMYAVPLIYALKIIEQNPLK